MPHTDPEVRKAYNRHRYQTVVREQRLANPQKGREAEARYRQKLGPAGERMLQLKSRYGITPDEYNALHVAQGGLCKVCHNPETAVNHTTGRVQCLSVDHDHVTGKIRGLLCKECNMAAGALHDNPDRCRALALYLETNK